MRLKRLFGCLAIIFIFFALVLYVQSPSPTPSPIAKVEPAPTPAPITSESLRQDLQKQIINERPVAPEYKQFLKAPMNYTQGMCSGLRLIQDGREYLVITPECHKGFTPWVANTRTPMKFRFEPLSRDGEPLDEELVLSATHRGGYVKPLGNNEFECLGTVVQVVQRDGFHITRITQLSPDPPPTPPADQPSYVEAENETPAEIKHAKEADGTLVTHIHRSFETPIVNVDAPTRFRISVLNAYGEPIKTEVKLKAGEIGAWFRKVGPNEFILYGSINYQKTRPGDVTVRVQPI